LYWRNRPPPENPDKTPVQALTYIAAVHFAPSGDGPVKIVEGDTNGIPTKVWTTVSKGTVGNPRERFFYFDGDRSF
jgi:hypothetical protein